MKPSEKALLPSIVLLVAAGVVSGLDLDVAVLPHSWHKLLHVAGAVMMLGNITVTALWMTVASFGEPPVREFAAKVTSWTDAAFTGPGAVLLLVNGTAMAPTFGGLWAQPWVVAGFVLFGLTGLVWLAALIPAQHRMLRSPGGSASFTRAFRVWTAFGVLATLLPWIAVGVMVLRP